MYHLFKFLLNSSYKCIRRSIPAPPRVGVGQSCDLGVILVFDVLQVIRVSQVNPLISADSSVYTNVTAV